MSDPLSEDIRPFPVQKFADRLSESVSLSNQVGSILDKAFADGKHVVIVGVGTPKRAELSAFYNMGDGFSFGGFVKLEPHQKVDFGVVLRFAR